MSILKFRTWFPSVKEMAGIENWLYIGQSGKIFDGSPCNRGLVPLDANECIIMQSTGLLDKNGKEIYEGDILKKYHMDTWYEGELKTNGMKWWIDNIVNEKEYMDETSGKFCEIIGNVYEHPNLLPLQ